MSRLFRTSASVAAAACLAVGIFGAGSASAQQVSGRGQPPGVEVVAGEQAFSGQASASAQQSAQLPLVLPRTGGPGGAELLAQLVVGLSAACLGVRLRSARRGRNDRS
jgi:hypothetical protein